MQKYFDFVSEKLFDKSDLNVLMKMFLSLKLKTIYVTRIIKNKSDFQNDFNLPIMKSIIFKKAYLFETTELYKKYNLKKDVLCLIQGKSVKQNASVVNLKNQILFDMFSEKLSFDEENAKQAGINKVKILFNVNDWRNKFQSRIIKQSLFIIPLLKNNLVDMIFCSMAQNIDELVDFSILRCFLKNFDLNEELITRFLNESILKK
jgi:hypothetical protein